MPRRPDQTSAPNQYVVVGGAWPGGPFVKGTPLPVRYAAAIAQELARHIDDADLSVLAAAQLIGVSRRTLHAVLSGHVLPDMRTVVLAEAAFGAQLWPSSPDTQV